MNGPKAIAWGFGSGLVLLAGGLVAMNGATIGIGAHLSEDTRSNVSLILALAAVMCGVITGAIRYVAMTDAKDEERKLESRRLDAIEYQRKRETAVDVRD